MLANNLAQQLCLALDDFDMRSCDWGDSTRRDGGREETGVRAVGPTGNEDDDEADDGQHGEDQGQGQMRSTADLMTRDSSKLVVG